MDLSAEQFIEMIASAQSEGTESGDPRHRSRVGLSATATIIPLGEHASPTASSIQVRDVSSAGIGFLHAQKMRLDEQFALVLSRANDTPSVVLCTVAFWQPLSNNLFAIGARFTRVLRDGGTPPLPIETSAAPAADLADQVKRLHRRAS